MARRQTAKVKNGAQASQANQAGQHITLRSEYHRGEREARRMFAEFGEDDVACAAALLPRDLDYLTRQVRAAERLQDAVETPELTRAFHTGFAAFARPKLDALELYIELYIEHW